MCKDKKIQELEEKYKKLSKEIEALKESEEFIDCPFDFEWEPGATKNHHGLVFGNDQVLYYSLCTGNPIMNNYDSEDNLKMKVRKIGISHDELEPGKWYVVKDSYDDLNKMRDEISRYKLYLGNDDYIYVNNNKDCVKGDSSWSFWHEVVPVEED